MESTLIFICIILFASILQTSTGFGFSIVATPFLFMLFDSPYDAIQINIILSLLISISLVWKIRKEIDFTIVKRFTIGSIAGIPLGILILLNIGNINHLKLGVSIILLTLTVLLMFKFKLKQTRNRDYFIGGLSGLLTTSIGMPGPPLLLYFTGTGTNKEKLRATTLAFYLFIYFISLSTQIVFAGTSKTIWESSVVAIPFVVLGMYLGQILFKKINQQNFRILTYILLLFTGVYLLIESLGLM